MNEDCMCSRMKNVRRSVNGIPANKTLTVEFF
jgi:hypothetical protein